jgi:hypothetical protein
MAGHVDRFQLAAPNPSKHLAWIDCEKFRDLRRAKEFGGRLQLLLNQLPPRKATQSLVCDIDAGKMIAGSASG